MRRFELDFFLIGACLCLVSALGANSRAQTDEAKLEQSFERALSAPVASYDCAGRPLVDAAVELAYKYRIPMSLQYVDPTALRQPINLRLQNTTPRSILDALVKQAPKYKISFSEGIVQIYSPKFRADASNLFNRVIPDFEVKDEDSAMADMYVSCALARSMTPPTGCGGSHPMGSPLKISLRMKGAKVYEILDAIVVKRRAAIWTVTIEPEKFTMLTQATANAWCVYSLNPDMKAVVLDKLRSLFPPGM